MPWPHGLSIYQFLKDNPGSFDLPDQSFEKNEVRWAPGAFDGVLSHHMRASEENGPQVDKLYRAFLSLLKKASDENLKELYWLSISDKAVSVADRFVSLISREILNEHYNHIGEIGRFFATKAPHREAVKFGLLLLELSAIQSDIPTLQTLARHDEFTLFAALALGNISDFPDRTLWDVARHVHGWGRIQVVERLRDTKDPEIKGWMIREGFRNEILDGYLALICAQTGGLKEELQKKYVDGALLDGAAGILCALTEADGPMESLCDYSDAAEVVENYLRHLGKAGDLGLSHFICVAGLCDFLSDESRAEYLLKNGWTNQTRAQSLASCNQLLGRAEWVQKANDGLISEDGAVFWQAGFIAERLGIDTRGFYIAKLKKDALSAYSWAQLLKQSTASDLDDVIKLAESLLPLSDIARGPAMEAGLGQGFEAHHALDVMLSELQRRPGLGWPLITAGIQSTVIRNRNLAMNALEKWPRESWPAETLPTLREALLHEPDEKVRLRLEQAIRMN